MRRNDGRFRSDSKIGKHFEEIVRLYNSGMSTYQIGMMFDIDSSNIFRGLKSRGVLLRNHSQASIEGFKRGTIKVLKGKYNPMWKGGRCKHSAGYVLIKRPEHPKANSQGYVPEHILVAEKKIGRRLRNDDVHHINYIKDDNRPENLLVMNKSKHQSIHGLEGALARWRNYRIQFRGDML